MQMTFFSELGLLHAKSNFSTEVPQSTVFRSTKMHSCCTFIYIIGFYLFYIDIILTFRKQI